MKYLLLSCFVVLFNFISAQQLVQFSIQVEKDRIDAPVSIALNEINYNTDKGNLNLYEIINAREKYIPSQIETGHSARLWFILNGVSKKESKREFIIKLENKTTVEHSKIELKKDHKDLNLVANNNLILSYRHAETLPPNGINPLYKRSGFIHPLTSPGGEILSRIQAPDHYHHYGIWGPWTKTHIDDREVDFWNLLKGQGTVKFAGFLTEEEGTIYSGYKALQQHIDFGAKGEDQIAMNEILDVRAWNIGEKVWVVDYTTSINSPLESGIMLDAYRYGGGIGFRATEKWHKDNCTVLTSDNKTRIDADGSYARWCLVEGESAVKEGRSGILFLSHPSNRMHPEPMRIWPLDANNGRGDMYFEFVPIRHDDWKLESNTNYTLKYRMIVFDGELDAKTAEMYWQSFASNPTIKIEN